MQTDKVTRGEQFLNRIMNDGLISEQGKDWLIVKVDPFHDKQLKNLAGAPDAQTGASVVRFIKQSMTLQAPPGTTTNWDCHVIQWPWLMANQGANSTGNFSPTPRVGQVMLPATLSTVQNGPVGGLQAFFVPPGDDLQITQPPASSVQIGRLDVPQAYTEGVSRLLSMGFEVHNTTSQLNVQGSACVYRQMSNDNKDVSWTIVDTVGVTPNYTFFDGPLVRYPPSNLSEAMLLSGTRQWEAKEGCYCVAAFFSAEDRATAVEPGCPVIGGDLAVDLEGVVNTTLVNMPIPSLATAGGTNVRAVPSFRVYNVHQSGAIFTGLSASTTLTVNWNVIIETFPDSSQQDILPLATPSGEYDPDALDLYTRIISELPVGVPVRENGLGDWFLSAVSEAAKFLGPTLLAMPHPVAKVIGGALTVGAPIAEHFMAKQAVAKKPVRKAKVPQISAAPWNPPRAPMPPLPALPRAPRKKKPKRRQA